MELDKIFGGEMEIRMKNTGKYIVDFILDLMYGELWIGLNNSNNVVKLHDLANNLIETPAFENIFTALLIYHQLTEELIKSILRNQILIKKIDSYSKKIDNLKEDKRTTGTYISELEESETFPNKERFIEICKMINSVRNDFAHKLTTIYSDECFKQKSICIKSLYEEIKDLYSDEIHRIQNIILNKYRRDFHIFIRKNITLDLYKYIASEIELRLNRVDVHEKNELKVLQKYIDLSLNRKDFYTQLSTDFEINIFLFKNTIDENKLDDEMIEKLIYRKLF